MWWLEFLQNQIKTCTFVYHPFVPPMLINTMICFLRNQHYIWYSDKTQGQHQLYINRHWQTSKSNARRVELFEIKLPWQWESYILEFYDVSVDIREWGPPSSLDGLPWWSVSDKTITRHGNWILWLVQSNLTSSFLHILNLVGNNCC